MHAVNSCTSENILILLDFQRVLLLVFWDKLRVLESPQLQRNGFGAGGLGGFVDRGEDQDID